MTVHQLIIKFVLEPDHGTPIINDPHRIHPQPIQFSLHLYNLITTH
jgi:2,3-bisphosphoglycerate-independent phosphoglycerate mutase